MGELPRRVAEASGGPVVLVGAGGSFSAAEFGQRLFDQRGVISQAMTPLGFLQSGANLRRASVFIFSASGNNKDVLAAFSAACFREARSVTVICASKRSKIARMATGCARASVFGFETGAGRDGYLATNSLVATCILMARSFGDLALRSEEVTPWLDAGRSGYSQIGPKRHHYTILFSGWGKTAAVDLESKLSEAGLAASMLADYRHFAHGRHNWLDKQSQNTAVIALSDSADERLARATVARIPSGIPVWSCHTPETGPAGAIKLLLATFGFVASAGEAVGIDPGRPGVPEYGSKLYQLGPVGVPAKRAKTGFDSDAAVERKIHTNRLHHSCRELVQQKCERFEQRLRDAVFGTLVVDYDGTVLPINARNGPIPNGIINALERLLDADIPVFLATGRGDSIHAALQNAFSEKLWPLIHVGYLNGAFTLPLNEAHRFNQLQKKGSMPAGLEELLKADPAIGPNVRIKNKGWQITLEPQEWDQVDAIAARLHDYLARCARTSLRLVTSSHSLDILPEAVSKTSCLKCAIERIQPPLQALTIGDCGAYPGNDFELLHHCLSLSVDTVSSDFDSCWNLLPRGISHAQGGEFYLNHLTVQRNHFKVRI